MLKFYNYYKTVFYKGKLICHFYVTDFILEDLQETKKIERISWENISEKQKEHKFFTLTNTKQGRKVRFFLDNTVIKEWKDKELDMTIEYEYVEKSFFTINDILNYRNVDMAIQFLKEKGLKIK